MIKDKLIHLPVPKAILWACFQRDPFTRPAVTLRRILERTVEQNTYKPTELRDFPQKDRTTLSLRFTHNYLLHLDTYLIGFALPGCRTQKLLTLLADALIGDMLDMPESWEPQQASFKGPRSTWALRVPTTMVYDIHQACKKSGMSVAAWFNHIIVNALDKLPPVDYVSKLNAKRLRLKDSFDFETMCYRPSPEAEKKLRMELMRTGASATVFLVDMATNYLREQGSLALRLEAFGDTPEFEYPKGEVEETTSTTIIKDRHE